MPMYEYRCPQCGHVFEALRRFSQANDPADCPKCEGQNAQRQMSATAAVHTGGGGGSVSAGGGCSPRGGFT